MLQPGMKPMKARFVFVAQPAVIEIARTAKRRGKKGASVVL